MNSPLRVALLIESSRTYGRNLLAGIAAYARVYGPWTFYHEERSLGDPMPAGIKQWRPDGIIARLENRSVIRRVHRLGVPMIDVLHEDGYLGIPQIIPSHESIVRLAVEHFRERRLEHYAYCGLPGVVFSDERCRLFVRRLAELGYRVDVFDKKAKPRRSHGNIGLAQIESDAMQRAEELAAWLHALPKPVGLMACNDMRSYQVLSVCREEGILVPDHVAVLGVDNDTVQCELSDPPLSSIDNNSERVGFEAAAILDRMMQGGTKPRSLICIEPVGVIVRRSTKVLAIDDPDMVEIVRYVNDHACEGLTSEMLARHASLLCSTLERWFAKHLHCSVHEAIGRVQLERVKELLATSELSLGSIARLTGFLHVETMQRVFKKVVGQTPGRYRKERRGVIETGKPSRF